MLSISLPVKKPELLRSTASLENGFGLWQSMHVRGLNSRERQKQFTRTISFAAFYGLLALVSALVQQRDSFSGFWIIIAGNALSAFWVACGTRQRAAACLICVSSFVTVPHFLHWQAAAILLLAKICAALWAAGVIVLVWDWMAAKPMPLVRETIRRFPPAQHIPALAAIGELPHPADEARATVLERLRLQAMAAGDPLREDELQFVDYSRIPSKEMAAKMEDGFYQSHDYWGFKVRVIGLLAGAIRTDRDADPEAKRKYKKLIRQLDSGRRDRQLLTWLKTGFKQASSSGEKALDKALLWSTGLVVAGILVGGIFFFAGRH
jgi:hypothetical protein